MNELHHTFPAGAGLLGRVVDHAGAPLDGQGPLQDVRPATLAPHRQPGAPAPLWETGIKVIDCFAPLPLGGSVAMLASPGVGLVVAITELTKRLAAQRGGCAVIADLDDEAYPVAETVSMLREGGVEAQTAVISVPSEAPPEQQERLALGALTAAEALVAEGRDVILLLDDGLLSERTAPLLRGRGRVAGRGSLTLLLSFWRHTTPEPILGPEAAALVAEAQARLSFSRDLALQGIWPTIDPLASGSRLLEGDGVSDEHRRVARAARELLEQLQAGAADETTLARARRVLLFGGQPFFVAEPYTAKPGIHVPLEAALRGYGELVAGVHDKLEEAALSFTGALEA
jgi:F-type H+-transporting ATPase subunit beta